MKFLILGDIVGKRTVDYLRENLWQIRKELKIDAVIANGENASEIMGLSADDAKALLESGVDVLTGGNHIFHQRSLYPMLDDSPYVIRPLNLPAASPGNGETVIDVNGYRVFVLNLVGMYDMDHAGNTFETAARAFERNAGRYDFSVVDVHAEATAEKIALGYFLAGKATAVVGTHTHVQTADERILDGSTAYITDLGMCGPTNGVLGTDKDVILRKMTTGLPQKFLVADGEIRLCGVIVTAESGKATEIVRFAR
ncbi:MAG: YmdB family metallophosphoesterase [Clostridia bacterium]|nr:YmdB family metallophosphoesterase [Clostridia bacterium]